MLSGIVMVDTGCQHDYMWGQLRNMPLGKSVRVLPKGGHFLYDMKGETLPPSEQLLLIVPQF